MSSKPKSMEEITFSVCLNNRKQSTLELFIREHWLAKELSNNSALSLYLVISEETEETVVGCRESFYC